MACSDTYTGKRRVMGREAAVAAASPCCPHVGSDGQHAMLGPRELLRTKLDVKTCFLHLPWEVKKPYKLISPVSKIGRRLILVPANSAREVTEKYSKYFHNYFSLDFFFNFC